MNFSNLFFALPRSRKAMPYSDSIHMLSDAQVEELAYRAADCVRRLLILDKGKLAMEDSINLHVPIKISEVLSPEWRAKRVDTP